MYKIKELINLILPIFVGIFLLQFEILIGMRVMGESGEEKSIFTKGVIAIIVLVMYILYILMKANNITEKIFNWIFFPIKILMFAYIFMFITSITYSLFNKNEILMEIPTEEEYSRYLELSELNNLYQNKLNNLEEMYGFKLIDIPSDNINIKKELNEKLKELANDYSEKIHDLKLDKGFGNDYRDFEMKIMSFFLSYTRIIVLQKDILKESIEYKNLINKWFLNYEKLINMNQMNILDSAILNASLGLILDNTNITYFEGKRDKIIRLSEQQGDLFEKGVKYEAESLSTVIFQVHPLLFVPYVNKDRIIKLTRENVSEKGMKEYKERKEGKEFEVEIIDYIINPVGIILLKVGTPKYYGKYMERYWEVEGQLESLLEEVEG